MDRDQWLQRPWALLMSEQGRKIVAWEVQQGEETALWATACAAKALEAGHSLDLVQPILDGEVGGWSYELFKAKGCQHCKQFRRHAVVLNLVSDGTNHWSIMDGAGKTLRGITGYNEREMPLRIPKEWARMEYKNAEEIRQALREGLAKPVFR